ncbi:hypothetical protein [Nocardia niwae]|uniref:Uncharacterized protein n=2 Tax=Nocardia niwae TaxID=626084 RepID=A0ABV2X6Z6_9NOCA
MTAPQPNRHTTDFGTDEAADVYLAKPKSGPCRYASFDVRANKNTGSSTRRRSPRPHEPDMHLSLSIGAIVFEFAACSSVARTYLDDLERHCIADWATVTDADPAGLPRLPAEQLFLQKT